MALSAEKLIVSNDGTAQTGLLNILEILTFYKGGSLVYFDGHGSHWLAQGVVSANGIALDRHAKHLLVSHINSKVLGVYRLSGDYKSLAEVSYLKLGTAADNLWVDKDNAVWTVCSPSPTGMAMFRGPIPSSTKDGTTSPTARTTRNGPRPR